MRVSRNIAHKIYEKTKIKLKSYTEKEIKKPKHEGFLPEIDFSQETKEAREFYKEKNKRYRED